MEGEGEGEREKESMPTSWRQSCMTSLCNRNVGK